MLNEHDTLSGQKSDDCESRIAALRQQIGDSECQLQRLQHELSDVAEKCFEQEIIRLKKQSWVVTGVLTFAVSLSGGSHCVLARE